MRQSVPGYADPDLRAGGGGIQCITAYNTRILFQLFARPVGQPLVPSLHAVAVPGGYLEDNDSGVYPARVFPALFKIKIGVRQQIGFVEQHDGGVMEHLRVFERFILTFGDGEDDHLVVLTKVKGGRADQVADIFYHQQIQVVEVKIIGAVHYHVGIQMAAGTGVDLAYRYSGRGDAPGIVVGLLVPLDDGKMELVRQLPQGTFKQGRLAGAGGTDQIQDENPLFPEQRAVEARQAVVFAQDIFLDGNLRPRS